MFRDIRPVVFWAPMIILVSTVVASLTNLEALLGGATALNSWILANFSALFSWGSFAFVVTCVWAFFSPLGRVTIGGVGAKPLLTKWSWFSVTLCTTIAIGILFWATAEPIFHKHAPPAIAGLQPDTRDAVEFAMSTLYMHWSFTPYAIYTVPGLTFALVYYNLDRPYSLSGPLSLVLGKWVQGFGSQIIDAVALFALIAGIAATLGVGTMSVSGGVARLSGLEPGPLLQGTIMITIVCAFMVSSATGLQRGIRLLSDINTKFFFLLCAFVFVAGPTRFMLGLGWDGLVQYVSTFLPRSLGLGAGHDEVWSQAWTVFYWANWLAWAPITALFLGRIAKGYTVRAFIMVNMVVPSLFAIVWMTVFGGASLFIDGLPGDPVMTAMDATGPEAAIYEVLSHYPISTLLMAAFVLLSLVSYITAADSNTEAIAGVCLKTGDHGNAEGVDDAPSSVWIKLVLGILIAASAWVMTAFSGIDGVRMMSNLGGFPALMIVLLLNVALILLGTKHLAALKAMSPGTGEKKPTP
ncbi:BCCT family transporter [Kordiimonas aestuarii]|uniref:BCCT family transporter n=1 Tax=Kordiimonas aestuarii TaxID=1005925 RepID=UPI0021D17874|nr:BCCT family transporter [Kordiimonas aestuarii]